jgi:hypothetical protein
MPEFPGVTDVGVAVAAPEAGGALNRELFGPGRCSTTTPTLGSAIWSERLPVGRSSVSTRMSGVDQTSVSRSAASASTTSASASRAALTETWMDQLNALGVGHGGIVDIPGAKRRRVTGWSRLPSEGNHRCTTTH